MSWLLHAREQFRELPPPDGKLDSLGPPKSVRLMRAFGVGMCGLVLFVAATTEPRPALTGTGLGVSAAILAVIVAVPGVMPRRWLPPFQRALLLTLLGAASVTLSALQPDGAAVIGVYMVVVVAALRLPLAGMLIISVATIGAEATVIAVFADDPSDKIFSLISSIVPWLLVMRLVRNLRTGRDKAERLLEELEESREAEAEAAAQAERGRMARDMHDVLAHSLSALALQLEGARLLARNRDSDPEVVQSLERAHHLAAGGLEEARRAIATLHGDRLPGPDGLDDLARAFTEHSAATCDLRVTGEPRELSSEAGLAVYRTGQEALTNVRKHAAPDRVEMLLAWSEDGLALEVADHGPGAPVIVGAGEAPPGSGYGLSGMRERAELLGGTLEAGATTDGFRVKLWLPA